MGLMVEGWWWRRVKMVRRCGRQTEVRNEEASIPDTDLYSRLLGTLASLIESD